MGRSVTAAPKTLSFLLHQLFNSLVSLRFACGALSVGPLSHRMGSCFSFQVNRLFRFGFYLLIARLYLRGQRARSAAASEKNAWSASAPAISALADLCLQLDQMLVAEFRNFECDSPATASDRLRPSQFHPVSAVGASNSLARARLALPSSPSRRAYYIN